MSDDGNLFDKPSADWTDRELAVGLAQLGRDIQWHADQRDTARVMFFTGIAVQLASERDRRAALARQVSDIATPTAHIVDWPDALE